MLRQTLYGYLTTSKSVLALNSNALTLLKLVSTKSSVSSFHAEKPQLAPTVKKGRPNFFH
jgi:hypothetical protein